ncbi:MAG: glutathione S-transferase family protein [Pseudomonadota bacterium]
MLRLYSIPVSLYSAKLRIVLRHKGLAFEEIPPPGGYGSEEYKRTVPSGNIPAMVDGELMLADSEAIAEYLEERHPAPSMLPGDAAARARLRERSRFHDTRLEPELRALFPHMPPRECPEAVAKRQGERLNARLAQLAVMLGPEAGTTLTLGDAGLPITFAWMDAFDGPLPLGLQWPEAVTAYRARLAAHPAVRDELDAYAPAVADYVGR